MEKLELVQLKEQKLNQRNNKMTEKDYNPEQKNAKVMKKQEIASKKTDVVKAPKDKKETKKENKTEEKKKVVQKIVKKDEAIINVRSLPISTKTSMSICRFIKGKPIEKAMADLDEVLKFKKAVPMKGEIPHRKGKIMSGRYPINAVKHFKLMLKHLLANSNVNGLEEPIIVEAIPNKASRPFGRMGAVKRKRTHLKIIAKDKNKLKKIKSKKSMKEKKK